MGYGLCRGAARFMMPALAIAVLALGGACLGESDAEPDPTATVSPATPGATTASATPSPTASVTGTPSATASATRPPATRPPGTAREVAEGEAFSLRVGEHVSIAGTGAQLAFTAVDADSRCPHDVTCIRAGEARVRLAVVTGGGAETSLTLDIPPGGSAGAVAGQWTVVVIELFPEPVSTRTLTPADYGLRLVITSGGDAQTRSIPVQVMFSRRPESDVDPGAVFPVERVARDTGVARFVIDELLSGPTPDEAGEGYFSMWTHFGYGDETDCGGRYSLRVVEGTATVRFCTTVILLGAVADGQAQSAMRATLEQFATIERVRILDRFGHCMFDLSGLDHCLEEP